MLLAKGAMEGLGSSDKGLQVSEQMYSGREVTVPWPMWQCPLLAAGPGPLPCDTGLDGTTVRMSTVCLGVSRAPGAHKAPVGGFLSRPTCQDEQDLPELLPCEWTCLGEQSPDTRQLVLSW